MRRYGLAPLNKLRWSSFFLLAAFVTPVALARSLHPSAQISAGIKVFVGLAVLVFAMRVPRQALRRLFAMRRNAPWSPAWPPAAARRRWYASQFGEREEQ